MDKPADPATPLVKSTNTSSPSWTTNFRSSLGMYVQALQSHCDAWPMSRRCRRKTM